MFSVTFSFRSEIALLKTTVCVTAGWGGVHSSLPTLIPSTEEKNLLFTHIGILTIFYGCLKFLPYSLPLYIEPIFANGGKLYILFIFRK